jgi:hypothetical protein
MARKGELNGRILSGGQAGTLLPATAAVATFISFWSPHSAKAFVCRVSPCPFKAADFEQQMCRLGLLPLCVLFQQCE